MTLDRTFAYRVATVAILGGFVLLVQPFFLGLFRAGLPVMIVGILLHAVLDHLPERRPQRIASASTSGRKP